MNWSRAKTILIVAFLILDLFLLIQLTSQQETYMTNTDPEEFSNAIIEIIENRYNVKIAINEFPSTVAPKHIPEVSWKKVEANVLAKAFWPDEEIVFSNNSRMKSFEDESLFVDDDMFYFWNNNKSKRIISVKGIVNDFIPYALKDPSYMGPLSELLKTNLKNILGIDFSNWILEEVRRVVENEQEFYDIHFIQDIGLPLYDAGSYTKIRIDSDGRVCGVKRAVLKEQKTSDTPLQLVKKKLGITARNQIVPAGDALLSFIGQASIEDGSIIKDIALAYYGLTDDSLIQGSNTPSKWELMLVWCIKIETPDGQLQKHFINAYTGKQE